MAVGLALACGAAAARGAEPAQYGWQLVGAGIDGHSIVVAARARPGGYCFADDLAATPLAIATSGVEGDGLVIRLDAAAPSTGPCNVPQGADGFVATFPADLGPAALRGPLLGGKRRSEPFRPEAWRHASAYLSVKTPWGCAMMPRLAGLRVSDARDVLGAVPFPSTPRIKVKGERAGFITATRPKAGTPVCRGAKSTAVVLRAVAVPPPTAPPPTTPRPQCDTVDGVSWCDM